MHALPSPTIVGRMLPSTARALPIHRAFLAPCITSAARRSYASSSSPRTDVLVGKKMSEKSPLGPGAETLHISKLPLLGYPLLACQTIH